MHPLILDGFADAATNFLPPQTLTLGLTPEIVLIGIGLVIITILILFFLKKVIVNSILGFVLWFVAEFIFHVQLPFLPSLVISLIFGPAGIGAMILLAAFGIIKP